MPLPLRTFLSDYTLPFFLVKKIDLIVDIRPEVTQVKASLHIVRNPEQPDAIGAPLVLDGEALELQSIALDGRALPDTDYRQDAKSLRIHEVPDDFTLVTEVWIYPDKNTLLTGLYCSQGNYCTQCESHGFRRITYFIDRPDILTYFSTVIFADQARYPVLLSNGNRVDAGVEPDTGRHWVRWEDPSLKPCYLFALVAGNYEKISDTFTTLSGRTIDLWLYVEAGKQDQASYAMHCLKRAMSWDERVYKCEYDLKNYMIVSVSDFNFGAMENKGLNIFNSKYILAKAETATDQDYVDIDKVIGHEYFHNWSGNRITCRDWFQLSLKEGLTVFRDQNFTSSLLSPVVHRIQNARIIRTHQFAEDAGPMAHPVRPSSYIEMNNFYTLTVYNKGAEIIRMLETLLGRTVFQKGLDQYFRSYDGQAVTVDELIGCMESVSQLDFSKFRRWYDQAGTPTLHIGSQYDPKQKKYTVRIRQSCPVTQDAPHQQKEPFYIPLAFALFNEQGERLPIHLQEREDPSILRVADAPLDQVLIIKDREHTVTFSHIDAPPRLSLLRNFSAPVKIDYDYSDEDLYFLCKHDTDDYNRWSCLQILMLRIFKHFIGAYPEAVSSGTVWSSKDLDDRWVSLLQTLLTDTDADPLLTATLLTLPSELEITEQMDTVDPEAIHAVRRFIGIALAIRLYPFFLDVYQAQKDALKEPYTFNIAAMGKRSLKNTVLAYLMFLQQDITAYPLLAKLREEASAWDTEALCVLVWNQFSQADNMTDRLSALSTLMNTDRPERSHALSKFYERYSDEALVLNHWFQLQAESVVGDPLATVQQLLRHPQFNWSNPNTVRSLIEAFCMRNPRYFHALEGEGASIQAPGYRFLTECIERIDPVNGQLAARLLKPFTQWKRLDNLRQQLMEKELKRLHARPNLSKGVYEIVVASLSVE